MESEKTSAPWLVVALIAFAVIAYFTTKMPMRDHVGTG